MNKKLYWSSVVAILLIFAIIFSQALVPFLTAFLFAYILHPLTIRLEKRLNISNQSASILVYLAFISIFTLTIVILVPLIINQFNIFVNKMPYYREILNDASRSLSDKISHLDPEINDKINEFNHQIITGIFNIFSNFVNHIWHYTRATISFVTIIFLVPILLFYFLRDWEQIIRNIEYIIPLKNKQKISKIVHSINDLLSTYIRGQLNICAILACYYSVILNLIGIDLAILLGIISGFVIIVPYIGSITAFVIVIINCYINYGFSNELLYVVIGYLIGHVFESYILTPRIIGKRIGLHPLWIMFSVIAGANLLGLPGILFAIPVAGIAKILLGNVIDNYQKSNYYIN